MNDLVIRSVEVSADILPLLKDFTCGVPEMDGILHSQGLLAEMDVDNPIAYCVYGGKGKLIGFCIIGSLSLPIEYNGHCEYVDTIDIACLAIHKDYQCVGIGTAILNFVCDKAEHLMPGVEFLHVDALDLENGYSAVPFYQKYGFRYAARSGKDVACMFYTLHKISD